MKTFYNEETHEYFVDDVKVPNITNIASPISFERLDALQKSLVDRAKARGSRCHELFEEYLLCGELDIETIETEYIPYVQQFILWAKTYRPKVIFTEKKLFSKDFCGTCDLICEIDGKTFLVDYKVTSSLDIKSLSVQLEGYKQLCDIYNISIDECYALHIKKDSYIFKKIETNKEWFEVLLKHNKFMRGEYNAKKK